MRIHRTRTGFAALGAAALLALTAGCGSGGSGGSSASQESSTSASASASESATPSPTPSESPTPSPSTSPSAAAGGALTKKNIFDKIIAAQKRAGTYTFTLSSGGVGQSSGSGEVDVRGAKPKVRSVSETAGQKVEALVIDGVYYFKGGPFGQDKWLKIDPNDDSSGLNQVLSQFSSLDPASALAAVKGAGKVRKIGSEQVAGTQTTHYAVVVDSKAYASALGLPGGLAQLLPATIDYDMFVDAKDLTRKVVVAFAIQGQKASTTITFADYGKAVSIKVPPASQTTTDFNGAG